MKSRAPAQQKGFTLVEIAIVLVIIGLLLGGVLKGQSLIEGSKVKALTNEFRGTATIINVYLDKYRAIPGDDINAVANTGLTGLLVPTVAGGGGNGIIDTGTWVGATAAVATNESSMFWTHARAAGIAGGQDGGDARNAMGGVLGVTSNLNRPTSPAGARGNFVTCASSVPGTIATQVDAAMDDGVGTTGYMFGVVQGVVLPVTPTVAAAYNLSSSHVMCFQS